ncbi:hypothetical protein GCM10009799_09300 [Nocardiopsis rhodophaea]|uniref:Uncharacterized protein n=1 Tax=Nocardiopsis rhodophaea TaxID=280238 RepID=A0ABN2SG17_9ACTN
MTERSTRPGTDLHRIFFSWRKSNLLGQDFGPSATSLHDFPQAEYSALSNWADRLNKVGVPEFALGQAAPSHWYRRFNDGNGALLYRKPEQPPRDARSSTTWALVGADLNMPGTLVASWEKRLLVPRREAWGWGSLEPVSSSDLRRVSDHHGDTLYRHAARRPELTDLVAAVLEEPTDPIDIMLPEDPHALPEHGRLLLLWGLYHSLVELLGSETDPRFPGVGWSFCTYEPWPADMRPEADRPRIAFRPYRAYGVPEGWRRLDLTEPREPENDAQGGAEANDSDFRAMAGWLIDGIGNPDGVFASRGEKAPPHDIPWGQVLKLLSAIVKRDVPRRSAPREQLWPEPSPSVGGAEDAQEAPSDREPPRLDTADRDASGIHQPTAANEPAWESTRWRRDRDDAPPLMPGSSASRASGSQRTAPEFEHPHRHPAAASARTDAVESSQDSPSDRPGELIDAIAGARDTWEIDSALNRLVYHFHPELEQPYVELRWQQPRWRPVPAALVPWLAAGAIVFLVVLTLVLAAALLVR